MAEELVQTEAQRGRPSDFTQKLADDICDRIACTNRGLDWICSQDDTFPHPSTIHRWTAERPDFRESYLRARERQADLIFDECLEIADDSSGDVTEVERDDGTTYEQYNSERVARSKLRVDTRMRMAGKLAPKKYGDKLNVDHAGEVGIVVEVVRFGQGAPTKPVDPT